MVVYSAEVLYIPNTTVIPWHFVLKGWIEVMVLDWT